MNRLRSTQTLFILYAIALLVTLASLFPRPTRSIFKMKSTKPSGSLAIVRIQGPIRSSQQSSAWNTSDAEDIAQRLHAISEDEKVKAILLRINSPGGTVGGVQEIYTELQRCRAKGKTIVASLGDIAASGGYYLAAASDHIVSNPGTITGSIGVIMEFGNLEGLFQKLGIRLQVIKSGAFKDIGSPARPLTPEEKRLLQAGIDDAYAQFVDAVAQGRKMPLDKVKLLADGRIFTGRQALKAGLVDELGNEHDAIQSAIRLANLPEKPVLLESSEKPLLSFMRQLSSQFSWAPLAALVDRSTSDMTLEYRF